ncbi:alpha/beta hydrolases superfamily protein [Tanacetum coccineum]
MKKGQDSCNKMFKKSVMVLFIGLLALAYQNTYHPPPLICGSPGGPPITGPRVVLRDGRHLAYNEYGVSRNIAKYKIVFAHGFGSSRFDASVYHPDQVMEDDPDQNVLRSSRLAIGYRKSSDKLELGSKFYVIGYSMGQQGAWGSLKYIPHSRGEGSPTSLQKVKLNPFLNSTVTIKGVERVKWVGSDSKRSLNAYKLLNRAYITQQGLAESILRDMKVGFAKWEFDPMEIKNPFPNNEGSVHLWHGDDDGLVPVSLQRYIAKRLPYIHYHELPSVGHLLPNYDGMKEAILKSLLLGEY